jgi:hypothetical protein
MKFLTILALLLISNGSFAQMEVFCTYGQCKDLGLLGTKPINTDVYIIDSQLFYAEKINAEQLNGVTSLDDAKALLPKIEKSDDYKKMIDGLKRSGAGINKIVNDYKLEKLPAYVCHPLVKTVENELEFGVIYGGSFKKASVLCSQWIRRTRK